ncbi:hypothetical protein [Salinimonas iocasae]|uniref:Uncharacterized protein n=2 Tax=Salinimonas TaxID=288793 RepID=A0A5B7YKJ1_9ALTE|nr:hypothetical protein [Salinimonas iocasae]QCZ95319.1 hypothetical protein FBQ74_17375 [Salinimonas iocasae]
MRSVKKQSGMALIVIFMLLMSAGALFFMTKAPQLMQLSASDKEAQVLVKDRTERLIVAITAYHRATCQIGIVTQDTLQEGGFLQKPVNLPQLNDIHLKIEKSGYSAAAVIDAEKPQNLAVLSEIMPLGASVSGDRVKYVRSISDRSTPMQRMIMADINLYSANHC